MASTICWHCHQLAQMVCPDENVNGTPYYGGQHIPAFPDWRFSADTDWDKNKSLLIFSCVNCGFPNIAEVETSEAECTLGYDPEDHIIRWLPIQPMGKVYANTPEDIASMASEVHKCHEIGADRAAVILARSVMEGIVAKQEEVPPKKKLYERIEDLKRAGKITSRTADAATAIRLCGNDYVHNVLEQVDREYTEIVVQILDSVIDDLYSNPSLVSQAMEYANRRRQAQQEKSNGTNR